MGQEGLFRITILPGAESKFEYGELLFVQADVMLNIDHPQAIQWLEKSKPSSAKFFALQKETTQIELFNKYFTSETQLYVGGAVTNEQLTALQQAGIRTFIIDRYTSLTTLKFLLGFPQDTVVKYSKNVSQDQKLVLGELLWSGLTLQGAPDFSCSQEVIYLSDPILDGANQSFDHYFFQHKRVIPLFDPSTKQSIPLTLVLDNELVLPKNPSTGPLNTTLHQYLQYALLDEENAETQARLLPAFVSGVCISAKTPITALTKLPGQITSIECNDPEGVTTEALRVLGDRHFPTMLKLAYPKEEQRSLILKIQRKNKNLAIVKPVFGPVKDRKFEKKQESQQASPTEEATVFSTGARLITPEFNKKSEEMKLEPLLPKAAQAPTKNSWSESAVSSDSVEPRRIASVAYLRQKNRQREVNDNLESPVPKKKTKVSQGPIQTGSKQIVDVRKSECTDKISESIRKVNNYLVKYREKNSAGIDEDEYILACFNEIHDSLAILIHNQLVDQIEDNQDDICQLDFADSFASKNQLEHLIRNIYQVVQEKLDQLKIQAQAARGLSDQRKKRLLDFPEIGFRNEFINLGLFEKLLEYNVVSAIAALEFGVADMIVDFLDGKNDSLITGKRQWQLRRLAICIYEISDQVRQRLDEMYEFELLESYEISNSFPNVYCSSARIALTDSLLCQYSQGMKLFLKERSQHQGTSWLQPQEVNILIQKMKDRIELFETLVGAKTNLELHQKINEYRETLSQMKNWWEKHHNDGPKIMKNPQQPASLYTKIQLSSQLNTGKAIPSVPKQGFFSRPPVPVLPGLAIPKKKRPRGTEVVSSDQIPVPKKPTINRHG